VLAGKNVTLSSNNPAVVSVMPAEGTTDANGRLTATVSALAQGNATITASTDGNQASTAITVPARSAALPQPLVLALGLLAGAVLAWRRRTAG